MSTKSTTNVPAFACALRKVLAVEQVDILRNSRRGPGAWFGHVSDLWSDLQEHAGGWIRVTHDRPHERSELRRDLKRHAVELHRDHGVVVTLDGQLVNLKYLRGAK